MEKVYLLLRQNTELGPFTLSELSQLQLQPTDLLWIEGESKSWSPPSILSDQTRNEYRGPDTNDWVSPRSEEGRETAPQKSSQASFALGNSLRQRSELSGSYREEEDIELIFHKKGGPTVNLTQLLAVAAITALLALAWENRFALLQTKQDTVTYASSPTVFVPKIPEPSPMQSAALVSEDSSGALIQQPVNKVESAVNVKKKTPLQKGRETPNSVVNLSPQEQQTSEVKVVSPVVEIAPEPVKIDTPVASNSEGIKEEEPVKKKTLGQALKGLFKKKNKEGRKKDEPTEQ